MRNLRWVVIGLTFLMCSEVLAGNIGNRTNHSAEMIRMGHRYASKSVDAAIYNPAGTTYLADGFHLGFGNQFILKSDTLTYEGSDFKATDPVVLYPNISAVYSQNDWALSLHIGVPAGGGAKAFKDGHPVFSAYRSRILGLGNSAARQGFIAALGEMGVDEVTANAAADDQGPAASAANLNGTPSVTGKSMYIGTTVSFAYAINDWLSVALGGRMTIGLLSTVGEASYKLTLTEAGETLAAQAPELAEPINIAVNTKATGFGVSPHISIHAAPMEGLDLTLSFHMQTNMNFDREYADCPADVQADGVCTNTETGIRDVSRLLYETVEDGFALGTFRTDIPAQLNIGASYVVVPDFVRLEASFAYFFHGLATWGTEVSPGHPIYGQDKGVLYVDGWEAGLGVEFDLDVVLVSAGVLYAKNGATEESLSYLFWGNDAVSGATGATWVIDDSMTATLGITYARYFPTSSEALGMDYDWWALDVAAGMTYSF